MSTVEVVVVVDPTPTVVATVDIVEVTVATPGLQGGPGPDPELTIGTVTTEAPGDPATAAITGTSPEFVLDLGIPEGEQGDPGPANELSIGTVTTGVAGSSASATITGTPPTQTLDLTIPRGDKGDTGDVAPGNIGNLLTANVATGTDTLSDTTGFTFTGSSIESSTDFAWQGTRSLKMVLAAVTGRWRIGGTETTPDGSLPVVAGYTYTGGFYLRAGIIGGTPGGYRCNVTYFDAGGTSLAANVGTASVVTTDWQLYRLTTVAPAGATQAVLWINRTANATIGDEIYTDGVTFHVGAGGLWVPPGIPVPNLGIRANPANATQVQVWNPGNATWITV